MDERDVTEMDELIQHLNEFPNHFIFRGQANAEWGLESSLERTIGEKWSKDNAKKFEEFSLTQFQSKFHLYDRENVEPDSKLAWLSIMQHYGVPTRLVDFTESPYVALYFAVESYSPQSENDLSLYAVDYSATMEVSLAQVKEMDDGFNETQSSLREKRDVIFEDVVDRFSHDILWVTEPKQLNARLDRQAGSFLLSGNGGKRIEEVLSSDRYASVDIVKFRIDHALYPHVFALLRKMNLTK